MIKFFLPCVPFKVGLHHKGRCGHMTFDKPELVDAKHTYQSLLLPFRPQAPLEGSVKLELNFYFPFNKGASKKFRECIRPKNTKPDCDNLAKVFKDCLQRMCFFHDDGQVFDLTVRKFYSNSPGIQVVMETAA